MKILKISSENKYFEDVVGLYEAAFPADERREVAEFSRLADTEKKFHINVFVGDNDEFIGFLTSWEWNDFRYGEHFAISPEMRCGGMLTISVGLPPTLPPHAAIMTAAKHISIIRISFIFYFTP